MFTIIFLAFSQHIVKAQWVVAVENPPENTNQLADHLPEPCSFLQHLDVVTVNNSIDCPGGIASWWRVFEATPQTKELTSIDLGIYGDQGFQPLTIKVHRLNGVFNLANLSEIASTTVTPTIVRGVENFPISGVIPSGQRYVVEVTKTQITPLFVIGTNAGGETADSYLSSSFCNVPEPLPISTQTLGTHNLLITVNSNCSDPIPTLSQWGIAILALFLIILGSLVMRRSNQSLKNIKLN